MSQELHYTSAPRGLWPGSQGYCTVACTANIPRSLAERLEGLSAYRNIFPPHDPRAEQNPVVFSHLQVSIGGAPRHVLSRIGFAGLDYSGRANKYAHHVILDPSELPRGGPAWLLSQPGFVSTRWNGRVGWIDAPHAVPRGDVRPRPCAAWAQTAGDAGWAGILADAFLAGTKPVAYLIHEPDQDILPLVLEAQALLPAERRWDLTFNTYVTTLPQGVVCAWRGVARDTPEEAQARRAGQALVLDLTRPLGIAPAGPLVTQARTGRPALPAARPSPPAETGRVDRQPMVLQPVATGPYAVVPQLPQPHSVDSAERPRSRTPRRRRARLMVAAVCALLIVGGGLGVALIFKHHRARNQTRAARTNTAAQPGTIQPAARTVQAVDPPGRHAAQALGASPVTPATPTPAAPANGSNLPARTAAQQPAAPERSTDMNAPRNAVPELATKRGPAVPDPKPPAREIRWLHLRDGLPPVFPIQTDTAICDGIKLSGQANLRLLGIKDPELLSLGISTREDVGKKTLYVAHEAQTSPFGRFWIDQETLHFRWLGLDSDPSAPPVRALRSCVLAVSSSSDALGSNVEYRVVLRGLLAVPEPLKGGEVTNAFALIWNGPETQAPYGRRLTVSQCTLGIAGRTYATSKRADSGHPDSEPVPERFDVIGVPRLSIVFRSDGSSLYPKNFQLAPTTKGAVKHAMENVESLKELLLDHDVGLADDDRKKVNDQLRAWSSGQEFYVKNLHQRIDGLRDIVLRLRNRDRGNIEAVTAELKKNAEQLKQLAKDLPAKKARREQVQADSDELAKKKQRLQNGLTRIEAALDHVGEFKEWINLVNILKPVKSQGCMLSIALTMKVDGEPVEVVRIGTVVDAPNGARISAQEKK